MKQNIGAHEGATRLLLFVVCMIIGIVSGSWLWVIPGVVLFSTATLNWCPVYELFGFNTTGVKKLH
jgi:hypothetical protein